MPTSSEIRQQFIDFFVQKHGHTFVPSSPVVPHEDPTLLFANAGMNQFKDVFLGTGTRPYKRAVNTQKCIRAGGKHNDLDDVGKDTYHHTFFEMLGNWSFGDYFKKEAISWAWELLTEVWKLDKTRLHVTVFEGDPENNVPRDDEAAECWKAVGVPPERIHLGNKKDNFWEMGETGPCGPCTEIHYDGTPDKSGAKLVNQSSDQVIEIWNNVFIQFNRNADKSLTPLPAKHVDTGMGFERVTKILQGKNSNYDTDVFTPIFDAIQKVTKAPPYTGKLDDLKDTAYRVIGDHIRTLTFSLTDGGMPDRVGRGYVIRSVLRRAERYGWQVLGTKEPFLHNLVAAVVTNFGDAFPELKRDPQKVRSTIYEEEVSFLRTLDRGIKLFSEAAQEARRLGHNTISGKAAFTLHTEQGLYIDITQQMAIEADLKLDRAEYDRLFKQFQTDTGGGERPTISAIKGELPPTDDSPKYDAPIIDAKVLGWVANNEVFRSGKVPAGEPVAILLDRTSFYAEQGGQVGDTGHLDNKSAPGLEFRVEDTQRLGDTVLHVGTLVAGEIKVGDIVTAVQNTVRRVATMRNHTATHLLNHALRQVLGGDIDQKGSLVDDEKTRFDFSHDKPLQPEELRQIEELVNIQIIRDQPVTSVTMPLAQAKKIQGLRAVFGEKYPDPVRVVMIGAESPDHATLDNSVEFCGGTHMPRSGTIGYFKILSQEGVSKGVRRVTATTGRQSLNVLQKMTSVVDTLSSKLNCRAEEVPARVDALQEEIKKLQKQIQKGAAGDLNSAGDKLFDAATVIGSSKLLVGEVPGAPVDQMRAQVDRLRQKAGSSLIVLGWKNDDGTGGFVVGVTDDLIKKGIKAGDIIKPVAEIGGGKGGGPPNLANAGCKDVAKLGPALDKAMELGKAALSK
ncbi:MAG: alanine--tRNA ligase [Planctomycetes bacterium]|nr:alanine--tRNA ligase [Planctomycetota bacterium]